MLKKNFAILIFAAALTVLIAQDDEWLEFEKDPRDERFAYFSDEFMECAEWFHKQLMASKGIDYFTFYYIINGVYAPVSQGTNYKMTIQIVDVSY